MKEKIEQLAKGKFEYELPGLLLSEEKLIIQAQAGKSFAGSFRVSNSRQRRMKGVVYSDNQLLCLEKTQFIGEDNEIPYVFHAEYARAGESFNGNLQLITDVGERSLPYEVQVIFPCFYTSIGEVRDLSGFTSLAKADWEEAEALFFSEDFERILFYRDDQYRMLYRTLAATGKKGQAMEEFLVAAGKKAPVRVELETRQFSYQANSYNFMDRLVLQKNGWGYAHFTVSVDAPFVQLERFWFDAGDFVNNRLEIGFVIQTAGMKTGVHSAQIKLTSLKKEMQVSVVCYCERKRSEESRRRKKQREAMVQLTKNYLTFRSGQKDMKQYLMDAENGLSVFQEEDATKEQQLMARFYQIHIWQSAQKETAVRNAMQLFLESGITELEAYPAALAAYYYLAAMQKRQSIPTEEAADKVRGLYGENPENWLLLWFLLYLDKDYADRKKRFEALKQHKEGKNHSPVLLFEAAVCLKEEPTLLRELGIFEMTLLQFAVDYGCLNEGVLRQLVFLAAREKKMSMALYRVLTAAYEKNPGKELLSVICTLIIRNGEAALRYFPWLKLGVEEQLRITELMEFYLACMDEGMSEPLHPSVYSYFVYHSDISAKKRALLYASLIRTKKENMAVYDSYRPKMEQFALEQLKAGNISPNLSILYQDVFGETFPGGEYSATLPALIFTSRLTISCERIQSVCVVHSGEHMAILPFKKEGTCITLCSEKAEIFLVDADGCYYPLRNLDRRTGGEYEVLLERLLPFDGYLWDCFDAGCDDLCLLMRLEEDALKEQKHSDRLVDIYRRLIALPELSPEHKNVCARALMEYYYENLESDAFEHYLKMVSLGLLEAKERARMINHLIARGYDKEAVQALKQYGTEGVDVRRISKLVYRRLYDMDRMEPDTFLLELSQYVFDCGKYEPLVLEYLTRYYHGSTEHMAAIWKAAKSEELDTVELEESLLGQILFAEVYVSHADAIFMSYYQHGMNRRLIRAYLSYYACRYLVCDQAVSEELFEIMEREVSFEENEICTLALLKAYSAEENLTEKQLKFIDYKLHGILKKGIFLPFFRKFATFIQLPDKLLDRYYVEYRTNPEKKVWIHYRIGNREDFLVEEMKDQCYGIFVKDFLLFEAESLQYYITEGQEDVEKQTESTTVIMNTGLHEGSNNRMDRLNRIILAHKRQEDATVLELLEQYILLEQEANQLFIGIE